MTGPVADLVADHAFRDGVSVGIVAALVCVALAFVPGRRAVGASRMRTRSVAAAAVCVGALVALSLADVPVRRHGSLLVGLAALAIAGFAVHRLPFGARLPAMLPGAVLVASTTPSGSLRVVPFAATLVGGAAVVEWPYWRPVRPAGPAMLAITALGVYACTPDTEHAAVVLGVALAIGCTGWPVPVTAVGAAGAAAFVGLVAWLAGTDGAGRPGAVVGASACIGVLSFVPALRWCGARLDDEHGRWGLPTAVACLVADLVVVGFCSRIAGLVHSAVAAAVIACIVVLVGFALLRSVLRL